MWLEIASKDIRHSLNTLWRIERKLNDSIGITISDIESDDT